MPFSSDLWHELQKKYPYFMISEADGLNLHKLCACSAQKMQQ